MRPTLTIFIDGSPFDPLPNMAFAGEMAGRARLGPNLGYSVNCQTEFFTGESPDEVSFHLADYDAIGFSVFDPRFPLPALLDGPRWTKFLHPQFPPGRERDGQNKDERKELGRSRPAFGDLIDHMPARVQTASSFRGPKPSVGMHGHHPESPGQHGIDQISKTRLFDDFVRAQDSQRVLSGLQEA
jgi:hypothetical protein